MSDNATTSQLAGDAQRAYRVTKMYHPSHHAPDLAEIENWFERVFARKSTPLSELWRDTPPSANYPASYSTFTPISDVLFDTIDPKLYVLEDIQRYATVDKPHLKSIGWFVENTAEVYRSLRRHSIDMVDQLDRPAEGEDPPGSAGSPMPLYFTVPRSTGLRYEFLPDFPFALDPRSQPDWVVPPVSDEDPLGIEFCSHHTVLTGQPERALKFAVDALGGMVIHKGRDEAFSTTSTYVQLADSVIEYAVPDEGTPAHADWSGFAPNDAYHSITWKVVDLDRVARKLETEGVRLRTWTDDTIVTDPETSIGVPWGFATSLPPGDPRRVG
jgi:hypothetical protein